jgi:hypothetical protein
MWQRCELFGGDNSRFHEQFQPVGAFFDLAERIAAFRDKLRFAPRVKRFSIFAPIEVPDRSNCFPSTCASVVFGSAENMRRIRSAKTFIRSRRSCSSFCTLPY